jgi:Endomembrane protein 70
MCLADTCATPTLVPQMYVMALQVHWFSILNSMMVVVVMSCIVAMIMMRTIRKDLAQYESLIVDSGGASSMPTLQLCFS